MDLRLSREDLEKAVKHWLRHQGVAVGRNVTVDVAIRNSPSDGPNRPGGPYFSHIDVQLGGDDG